MDFIEANRKLQYIWGKDERHHPFMIKSADAYHFFLHKQDAVIPTYLFVGSLRKVIGESDYTYVTDLLRPYEDQGGYDALVVNREQLTNGYWRNAVDDVWDETVASLTNSSLWEGFATPIEVLGALSWFIKLLPIDEVASLYEMLRTMSGHMSDHKDNTECVESILHTYLQSFEYFNAAHTFVHSGLCCVDSQLLLACTCHSK